MHGKNDFIEVNKNYIYIYLDPKIILLNQNNYVGISSNVKSLDILPISFEVLVILMIQQNYFRTYLAKFLDISLSVKCHFLIKNKDINYYIDEIMKTIIIFKQYVKK